MIKFFRNIRQNLLKQGKSANYLKYAVGEIVLVVIGILIALQINNWNEDNKERRLENTYLNRLTEDLEKDLADLDIEINKRLDKAEVAKKMTLELADVDYQLKRNLKEEDINLIIYGWTQFYPNNNTYLELLSTGNLNLIESDSIKNALFELNKQWLALEREYKTINDFRINWLIDRGNELSDNVSQYAISLSYTDKDVIVSEDQIKSFIEKGSKAREILNNDSKFRNGVSTEILVNNALVNILKSYKKQVEKLLNYLKVEKPNKTH